MNGMFGIELRAAPLGLFDVYGASDPGLHDVRCTHVAPPWADIGLCLRHGRARAAIELHLGLQRGEDE